MSANVGEKLPASTATPTDYRCTAIAPPLEKPIAGNKIIGDGGQHFRMFGSPRPQALII
jgi:hypothetical protein